VRRSTALGAFVLLTSLFVIGLLLDQLARATHDGSSWAADGGIAGVLFVLAVYAFPAVAVVILWHDPRNRIGWLLMLIGVVWGLDLFLTGYAEYGLVAHPGSLPGASVADAIEASLWVAAIGLMGIHLVVLFPDGHAPTPRSARLLRVAAVVIGLATAAILFTPGTLTDAQVPIVNPLGVDAIGGIFDALHFVVIAVPIGIVLAAITMVGRFRRSTGVERLQMKWIVFAVATMAALYFLAMAVTLPFSITGHEQPAILNPFQTIALVSFGLIPLAVGVAVMRYRLFEIDVVISKTVIFGGLAVFITVVYVAIVVGVGRLVGATNAGAGLEILATAVVAFLFQPVRDRVRRFANRLVYGQRATPYAVMADLGHRMAESIAIDRAMPQLAEITAAGVGATVARVRLFDRDRVATAPPEAPVPETWAASVDVVHQGEPIGDIAVAKAPGDPLRPAERALLDDLAGQAGLALHNVQLTDDLSAKADQLAGTAAAIEASQRRIVSVRDEQRRELEREISEGPRRGLEGIAAELRAIASIAPDDPGEADARLDALGARSNEVLNELRDIARGVFPPLLTEQGAVAALEAHIHKVGARTTFDVAPEVAGRRFDPEVEACLYFCGVQAIQNVMRHAGNAPSVLRLRLDGDAVRFELTDRGPGFTMGNGAGGRGTQILLDRLQALDGELAIESRPGEGTAVTGTIPLYPAVAASHADSSRSGPNDDFGM
jgi:signal transduction histidine kinase